MGRSQRGEQLLPTMVTCSYRNSFKVTYTEEGVPGGRNLWSYQKINILNSIGII